MDSLSSRGRERFLTEIFVYLEGQALQKPTRNAPESRFSKLVGYDLIPGLRSGVFMACLRQDTQGISTAASSSQAFTQLELDTRSGWPRMFKVKVVDATLNRNQYNAVTSRGRRVQIEYTFPGKTARTVSWGTGAWCNGKSVIGGFVPRRARGLGRRARWETTGVIQGLA